MQPVARLKQASPHPYLLDLATTPAHGRKPGVAEMSLGDAMERFLTHLKAAGRSPRTLTAYRAHWKRLLQFPEVGGGSKSLCEITPEMLDRWAASLQDTQMVYANHPMRKPVERALSDSSRLGYIQDVRALFSFCFRRGYIDRDVAADLKRPKINHSARNKVMPVQDLYRLLDAAQERAEAGMPRDLALLMFLADTGARRGEAATLRLCNLHMEGLEAFVVGKTDERQVDYTRKTAEALRVWLAVRGQLDHDYVFTGQGTTNNGGPLKADAINGIMRRLGKRAGVRRVNPQSIRHLVGQSWTDAVNLELVRMKLGHASVTTTAMFYAHQDMERVKAATQLNSLLNNYDK